MVHDDGPAGPNQVDVVFDDEHVVSDAGLVLCQTVAERLKLRALADECVRLDGRPGAGNEGRKVLSLLVGMLAGADSIDDCDVLRARAPPRPLALAPRVHRRAGPPPSTARARLTGDPPC